MRELSEEEYTHSEIITIKVSQTLLIDNSLEISDYIILEEISKIDHSSAKYLLARYPAIFKSRATLRRTLNKLIDSGFIQSYTDPESDLFTKTEFLYNLTKKGTSLIKNKSYKPSYTLEEYLRAVQVIDLWNSLEKTSTHSVKEYGEVQTKTVDQSIKYICSLLKESAWGWADKSRTTPFSISEIRRTIRKYPKQWLDDYAPEDKSVLPKSLNSFFRHYKSGYSKFFELWEKDPVKKTTAIDGLKEVGISAPVLKKAYEVLSATGSATEREKLEIQKSILRTHKQYTIRREAELDSLYSWNRTYQDKVGNFNVFLFEYLSFILQEVGKGNAKAGYISFNRGSKILEAFISEIATKYNIFLFPTKKKKEQIMKSKIVT